MVSPRDCTFPVTNELPWDNGIKERFYCLEISSQLLPAAIEQDTPKTIEP
jgi:hypothetical protein